MSEELKQARLALNERGQDPLPAVLAAAAVLPPPTVPSADKENTAPDSPSLLPDLPKVDFPVSLRSDNHSVRHASGRRVRSMWSDVEVHALVSGIKRVWRPDQRDMDWTAVLRLYPTVFGQRTALDLKDKWRNLVKSGLMPPMPKAK